MACIKKISSDLAFDCKNPGLISGIVGVEELILINRVDVNSLAVSNSNGEAIVTLKTGTRGYTVQCVKNSVQVTEAVRSNDNAPTMLEISVVAKLLSSQPIVPYINGILSGSFLAAVKTKTNQYFILGCHSGLEVSDFTTDSTTDGVSVATLKTPDGSCGDYRYTLTAEQYNQLKTLS